MTSQKSLRVAGIIFGAWLSWLYAFVADQVNRVNLPGISLPDPQGGVVGYYLGALLVGALIGLVCTWPENNWAGAALGGLLGALLVFFAPWQQALGSGRQAFGAFFLTLTTFIPMVLILMPFALLVRWSVNRLPTGLEGLLSPRRIGLPLLTTALAIALGLSGMVSADGRTAFYQTQTYGNTL